MTRLFSETFREHVQDPRRLAALRVRTQVESGIRSFFAERDFLETRTPLLVASPGMEPHIRPLRVTPASGRASAAYLPTSPEFAMKKLLAGGLPRIFQICPAFRDEPPSRTHSPEFTMLEWYRAEPGAFMRIMEDTEKLFESLAIALFGLPVLRFEDREISVRTPWPRLTVRELFLEHVGVDLMGSDLREACDRRKLAPQPTDTWDDLFFRLWLNCVEPRLPSDQACLVTRYPASQCALATVSADADGTVWANRFEAFAGGLELANAFEELTDAQEQRARFVADMKLREALYDRTEFPASPIDEEFLRALNEGLPNSAGIALGVDRLVMLLANEPDIAKTFWLPALGVS